MPEKEKDVVETIYKAVPLMSDFDKGYLYGKAETLLRRRKQKQKCRRKRMEKNAVEHVHVVARGNYKWHGTFFCPCGYMIGVMAYETVLSASKLRDSDPNGIQEAMFRFGTASAYITRLREDIRNTETDPEEDAPELPTAEEAGATAAEQKAEDTEDVILPKEEHAVGAGARIKVSNLQDAGTLPPTKEVRVPDKELPKPRRRGGRPKKKFTLDEELPGPLE